MFEKHDDDASVENNGETRSFGEDGPEVGNWIDRFAVEENFCVHFGAFLVARTPRMSLPISFAAMGSQT